MAAYSKWSTLLYKYHLTPSPLPQLPPFSFWNVSLKKHWYCEIFLANFVGSLDWQHFTILYPTSKTNVRKERWREKILYNTLRSALNTVVWLRCGQLLILFLWRLTMYRGSNSSLNSSSVRSQLCWQRQPESNYVRKVCII